MVRGEPINYEQYTRIQSNFARCKLSMRQRDFRFNKIIFFSLYYLSEFVVTELEIVRASDCSEYKSFVSQKVPILPIESDTDIQNYVIQIEFSIIYR